MSETDELIEMILQRQAWPPERRRNARTKHSVSVRELGLAVGVSHAAIANWEKAVNGHNPKTRDMERRYYEILAKLEELPA